MEAPGVPEFPGEEHLSYWQEHAPQPCYVYVVQGEPDTAVKIGKAKDVRQRIRELQTGNPSVLRLLYVLPGAYDLEWNLHQRVKKERVLGEWFIGPKTSALLESVDVIAGNLVAEHREDGTEPDVRRHLTPWKARDRRGTEVRITYGEPVPEEDRYTVAHKREVEYRLRTEHEFRILHSEPAFQPHRPK